MNSKAQRDGAEAGAVAAPGGFGIFADVPQMKQKIRDIGMAAIARFGMTITDSETGRPLGRALIFAWGGKVHVIGLRAAVRPIFLPQQRLTYWKQELGFTVHPAVDYPNERGAAREIQPER